VAIDTRVFEVDPSGAISTDDELQLWEETSGSVLVGGGDKYLIIPAVGAGPDLDPIGQTVSTAQEVGT